MGTLKVISCERKILKEEVPRGRNQYEVEVLVGRTFLRRKFIERNLPHGVCSPKEDVPQGAPNNRSLGMSPKCVHALITVGVVQNVQCLLLRIDHLQLLMARSLSLVEAVFQENS
jgi:hypothetical protein